MSDVFISYSRKDIAFAHILVDALKSNGLETWIDWEDIPPSADWLNEILRAIEAADTFVYIVSHNSKNSEVCSKEIQHAIENQKRLVPIVIHAEIKPEELPQNIAALNWIFFPDGEVLSLQTSGFQQAFDKLLSAIKTDLEWVKEHTRLQVRALEWQKNQYETSFTLRGRELIEAETWLAQTSEKKEPQPTSLQRQYVLESRKGADRRQRITLGAVSAGMLIAIVLAIVAVWQSKLASSNAQLAQANAQAESYARATAVAESHTRATAEYNAINQRATAEAASTEAVQQRDEALRQSKLALAGKLAAQSQLLFKDQLDLAMLLSVEASNTANTKEAQLSPRLALEYSPRLLQILSSKVVFERPFAISPDGQTLAIGECTKADNQSILPKCIQGQVVFMDLLTGQPTGQPLNLGQFSAGYLGYNKLDGGKTLILVGYSSIEIWDIYTRSLVGDYPTGQKEIRYYPTEAAFSPDGNLLAIGSCGDRSKGGDYNAYCNLGEIRLWDIQKRQLFGQPILAHDADVDALTFSPDSRILASASSSVVGSDLIGPIKLWEISAPSGSIKISGEPIQTSTVVDALAFSPDGRLIASGGSDHTVTMWDTASNQISGTQMMGHTNFVNALQFSPDGEILASGSWDDTLILWNVTERKPIGKPLVGHTSDVQKLSFSPDGQRLVSSDSKGTDMIWDTSSHFAGNPLGRGLTDTRGTTCYGCFGWTQAFSPDGNILAYSINNTIYLWDLQNNQPLGEPLLGHQADIRSLVFPPQGNSRTLVSASRDHATITWDLSTGKPIQKTGQDQEITIYHSSFSQDRSSMAYIAKNGSLVIISLPDGTKRQTLSLPSKNARTYDFALDQDASLVAALICERLADDQFCNGWSILTWDVVKGRPGGAVINGLSSVQTAFTLSPDGKLLAYALSQTGKILVVDSLTGKVHAEINPFPGIKSDAENLVFSPDGKLLAAIYSGDGPSVILWNSASSEPVGAPFLDQYNIGKPVFSPDGKILAWPLEGAPFLWDIANQKALGQPLKAGEAGGSLVFSPDGKQISIGGGWFSNSSNQVQIFDTSSGQPINEPLIGHAATIIGQSFNSTGQQLYTLSQDGTLDVWDFASGMLVSQPLKGYLASFVKVDLNPDGRQMALVACKIKPINDCVQSELWFQDTTTGDLSLQPLQLDGAVSMVRFSHNGKLLAISSGPKVIVWDAAAQETLFTIQDTEMDLNSMAFSPDDKVLATKSNRIILWDLANGEAIGAPINDKTGGSIGDSLAGTEDWGIAFSPDGRYLATTGSGSGSLLLVDIETGQPYGGLLLDPSNQLMTGMLLSVAFSPDGKTLASGSNSGIAILWSVDPEVWQELACTTAGRSLAPEEWAIYMPANDPYQPYCR
jgi:WD40 repeat protein